MIQHAISGNSALCVLLATLAIGTTARAADAPAGPASVDPLQLVFRRKAVRRFVLNNNISLSKLDPPSVVALDLMHNILPVPPSATAAYTVLNGELVVSNPGALDAESLINVGGINPFASYDVDVDAAVPTGKPLEVGLDLSPLDLSQRLVIAVLHPAPRDSVVLRVLKAGKVTTETPLFAGPAPQPPYSLRVQLGGVGAAVFLVKNNTSTLLANLAFPDQLDFRGRQTIAATKFNIATRLPPGASVSIRRAESYLSAGVGQADIRMITHRDGAPYFENNRLWFTFSARGFAINQSCQGVMSLDPSTFDPRFEGIILYDFGNGVLYNSYASHVFYDDEAREWRSWNCDFGGTPGNAGRRGSGLGLGRSRHDPRRGVSVLSARPLSGIEGMHEDPCGCYDAAAGKWRLLVTSFLPQGLRAQLFEAGSFEGPYTRIAGPVADDSTGTLIQKIGDRRYVFAGSSKTNVWVYSYPDLKLLGPLKMDLPPWNKSVTNGRIWPNIFPLPAGFPARYMAMMMDRANYTGVRGPNWSYGALYLYEAVTEDISGEGWEFAAPPGN